MPAALLPAASPEALAAVRRIARLTALAAAAERTNPFALLPLVPPIAYAAGAAHTRGAVVASAGRWYVALNGGTIPAAPTPPTHIDGSTPSDGAIQWSYLGPAAITAADPHAPTVTLSTTAPAFANVFSPPGPGGVNAAIVPVGGYAFNYGGYAGLRTFDVAAGNPQATHVGWEFETDAPSLAIGIFNNAAPVQLVIDGRRYAPGGIELAASGENWIAIDLPPGERGAHRIRIELASQSMALRDVRVGADAQVWAPGNERVRAVFLSDSILAGSGYGPFVTGGSAPQRIAALLGWADPWNMSTGGTGYTSHGSGYYNFGERIPEALTRAPDVWVIAGSVNDIASTGAAITAAALATYRAIRAGSAAPIIVLGVWPRDAAVAAIEVAVAAAVTAFGDPLTVFVPMVGEGGGPSWITGAWNNAANPGSSNATAYVSPDGTHPIDAGTAYLAERAARAIRRVALPRLMP